MLVAIYLIYRMCYLLMTAISLEVSMGFIRLTKCYDHRWFYIMDSVLFLAGPMIQKPLTTTLSYIPTWLEI